MSIVGQRGIRVDFSGWPIVVTTSTTGLLSDEDFEAYLVSYGTALNQRKGEYVAVVDLRQGGALTPKQRQRLTGAMSAPETGAQCVGTALIFESTLMRGMLTAILWIQQPKYPTKVFASVMEASDWGRELLGRAPAGASPGRSNTARPPS